MSLEERIITTGRHLEEITGRLDALGYRFEEPVARFPGPEPGTDLAIKRIEREIGVLPLAIKIFWRRVGSVNLIGGHPDWEGCEYPDPIVVFPPSHAIEELNQFLADHEERLRCDYPCVVPIAPDAKHKENVSGGMFYNLSVPATSDDPPLNGEPHRLTFVNYLELAVRWAGFPGLEKCAVHNWPLDAIQGRR